MRCALRVVALGKSLRLMAQEISADLNESYYLAHGALRQILNNNPDLSRGDPSWQEMRSALWAIDIARRTAFARRLAPPQRRLMLEAAA